MALIAIKLVESGSAMQEHVKDILGCIDGREGLKRCQSKTCEELQSCLYSHECSISLQSATYYFINLIEKDQLNHNIADNNADCPY